MGRAAIFSSTLRVALGVALASLLVAAPARATYSVVATDQATQQVGGATTSCVGALSVASVYGPSPGHGGINAQATQNLAGRDRGVMLLAMDVAPASIIQQITAATFDPTARTRQYGIADLSGRAAGFTGAGATDYKEDRQGTIGTYTYSTQGNILTSKAVLDQAEAAFRTQGCDLADKLMLALEGGAQNGEGDSRCTTTRNIPSDSASIEVDLSGAPAGSYLRLSLSRTMNTSPLIGLRTMFNTWRSTHPCPASDAGVSLDAGGARDGASADAARSEAGDATVADARGAGGGAGSGGAGMGGGNGGAAGSAAGAGTTGGAGVGSGGASGATGSAGTTGSTTTTGAATAGTGGANATGQVSSMEGNGCACRALRREAGSPRVGWGFVLAIVGLAVVRRRGNLGHRG